MHAADLRFGLVLPIVAHGVPATAFMRELVEMARTAETSGLQFCVVPEHHQGPDNGFPFSLTTATWLLAKTETIHIGTGVMVLPLYDPVHLAEETASLQEASGGRLIVGLGVGYQEADFALFDKSLRTRGRVFEESLKVLRDAWQGKPIRGQTVIPRVTSEPPVWIGGSTTPSIRRAATMADCLLTDPVFTVDEVAGMATTYREAADRAGRPSSVIVLRELWVDDTDEIARARFAPIIEPIFRYYYKRGGLAHDASLTLESVTMEGALAERIICGSPDTVADQIADLLRRTGADGCAFMTRQPTGPSHEETLRAVQRLGTQVLPKVRELIG